MYIYIYTYMCACMRLAYIIYIYIQMYVYVPLHELCDALVLGKAARVALGLLEQLQRNRPYELKLGLKKLLQPALTRPRAPRNGYPDNAWLCFRPQVPASFDSARILGMLPLTLAVIDRDFVSPLFSSLFRTASLRSHVTELLPSAHV